MNALYDRKANGFVELDVEMVINHINLENINKELQNRIIRIVADNMNDDAEIGRQVKLILTETKG